MKVAILGAGAFGTALGGVLTEKEIIVKYYDPILDSNELSDTITGADYMLLAVPSQAAVEVLSQLPMDVPLIVATKGLLTDELFRTSEDWMVLSGPGFADDIKAKKPTRLTASDKRVVELFETDYLSFDLTSDRKGMLMCGALKNVYAILAGIRELKPVTREHRQFLAAAKREMKAILEANGAEAETVDLNCGYGDLRITCFYPSRNYEFGVRVAREGLRIPDKTVEGVATLERIRRGDIRLPEGAELMSEIIEESKRWA